MHYPTTHQNDTHTVTIIPYLTELNGSVVVRLNLNTKQQQKRILLPVCVLQNIRVPFL